MSCDECKIDKIITSNYTDNHLVFKNDIPDDMFWSLIKTSSITYISHGSNGITFLAKNTNENIPTKY